MNILAIDYGKKRIGLAWCDTAVNVVLPYGVIQTSDFPARKRDPAQGGGRLQTSELVDLIKNERIEKVVMGLPVGLDGKENENTKNVRTFAKALEAQTNAPIEFIDERFTSASADRMGESGASRDEKAAMVILQSYIDRATS